MPAIGNLSKNVVIDLVKDATPEQIATLFTAKNGKPCTLASRARTIEILGLTGAKKKAVEEYVPPAKPKKRKTVVKRGTASALDYSKLSSDKLFADIKATNAKLTALKKELNNRLK